MFLLVNLFATFGALVLTIMGVAISLTYPIGGQRGHFVWMIAFVVVGIPATVATYFVVHLNGQATETAQTVPAVRRVEPNAFAVRHAPQARVERVRVIYGEHRNRPYGNRPQTVTYEVRQTVQNAVSPTIFAPPRTNSVIPSNTFSCVGFTKDPDGSWEAGGDTQPFNIGSAENIVIRNQGPIEPGWVTVGGVDLYDLVDKKCGAHPAH
jgi:hypothetical protein